VSADRPAGNGHEMVRHVVLLGLMGAGKTSIGRVVADRLGVALIDGDQQLADLAGRTAAEIAETDGIGHLHELEVEVALRALASSVPAVIGPAASVVESAAARDHMAGHAVVWLTAPVEYLARKAVEKGHRPLVHDGDPLELLTRQQSVREPLVPALDPLVIDVSELDDDAAADLIVNFAGERWHGS
jgi:shikimate kinase